MELVSNAKRQGETKGSNKACDPNPLCFWVVFLVPLKITLCRKMEPNTGTFWSNFHVFTDHNKFRKSKPSRPCISDSGADFEHGQTGWTFIVHFPSEADESRALVYLKLFALFVRSGHCTSESWERTKSHSSISTDFGSEQQGRMKPFIPSLPLFL